MNYKGDSGYEVLYPQSTVGNLTDFSSYMSNNYYNKSQVDSKDTTINNRVTQVDNRVTSVNNNLTALISSTANSLIQSPYGMICIRAMDNSGSPVSNQTFTVSPKIGQDKSISSFTTADNGMFVEFAQVGTYTITPNASIAQAIPSSMQVTVGSNELEYADFQIGFGSSGEMKITSSQTINFPSSFGHNVDLFLVGGGGGSLYCVYRQGAEISGGGGGYTKTYKNVSLSGQEVVIKIGNGGQGYYLSDNGYTMSADSGGKTQITISNQNYTAEGGKGGEGQSITTSSNGLNVHGGNGGSGGGGVMAQSSIVTGPTKGGWNGSDGDNTYGGTGQGSTTGKFGESQSNVNDIYAAGGGAYYYTDSYGRSLYSQSGRENNDMIEGSGDGGTAVLYQGGEEYNEAVKMCSGHSGCVIIRWPSR